MQKSIAFIFTMAPYGNTFSFEGLDVLLTAINFFNKIGVFFISDGVFLLLPNQKTELIMSKNFFVTFNLLVLHELDNVYLCIDSIISRGLNINYVLSPNIKYLTSVKLNKKIKEYDYIITF